MRRPDFGLRSPSLSTCRLSRPPAGHERIAYNSCRDRSASHCARASDWHFGNSYQAELLNTQYFHVVFTVPQEIAAIAFQNKRVAEQDIVDAAARLSAPSPLNRPIWAPRSASSSVLHTWGQNLLHYPHLHCLVPGGGISPDGQQWIACRLTSATTKRTSNEAITTANLTVVRHRRSSFCVWCVGRSIPHCSGSGLLPNRLSRAVEMRRTPRGNPKPARKGGSQRASHWHASSPWPTENRFREMRHEPE